MEEIKFSLENQLVSIVNKDKKDFSRKDLLKIISLLGLERITFHYVASDGRIRELRIPIQHRLQVEQTLADGERVDGSSLFKGMVEAGKSDLYVVPIYRTAFINPFDPKSIDFVCRFFDQDGEPANFTPDNILVKAKNLLKDKFDVNLFALGELEFYLIFDNTDKHYVLNKQRGYHAASPYAKTTSIVNEMLSLVAQITGNIKYAHNEVGFIASLDSEIECLRGKSAEQVEIEFNLADVEDTANDLMLSAWIIRNVARKYNAFATFFPKIDPGHAGNGLHFHLALQRNGENIMTTSDGNLSEYALQLIGALCQFAPSLTAFGNTVSASYLRLVPGQEAPTRVCWSHTNRNALIRIPLAWTKKNNLAMEINPAEKEKFEHLTSRQTVELRSPDGSALVHLLLAGICVSANWGLSNPEKAINLAKMYEVKKQDVGSLSQELEVLGTSCVESSEKLLRHRAFYESDGIFPSRVIDHYVAQLQNENDKDLNKRLLSLPEEERIIESRRLMHKNLFRC